MKHKQYSPAKSQISQQQPKDCPADVEIPEALTPGTSRKYPNPGYLGTSSHTAIFHHLPTEAYDDTIESTNGATLHSNSQFNLSMDEIDVSFGAQLLDKIDRCVPIQLHVTLVEAWLAMGVNMMLAGPFTKSCIQAVKEVFENFSSNANEAVSRSKSLSINSCQQLATSQLRTFEEACAAFCFPNIRWETIGLFFTAVSRATIDLTEFQPLYDTKQKRQNTQRLAMRFADDCLNVALSLDNMNDLLLILQHENFVNHSHVDGDQST